MLRDTLELGITRARAAVLEPDDDFNFICERAGVRAAAVRDYLLQREIETRTDLLENELSVLWR